MASLFNSLKDFKDFKNGPAKSGLLHGSLSGLRKKVIIPVPTDNNPSHRWSILKFLTKLIWSGKASGSVTTGAALSLLSIFAEQPSQMLRSLINDPDLEVHIIDLVAQRDGHIKFSSRGLDLTEQEQRYEEIAEAGPDPNTDPLPFINPRVKDMEIRTTEDLQKAVSTVTIQVWILLTKAVTAPDTAKESENKRWIKYLQQKRVDDLFKLRNGWLDIMREKISQDISIRRFMVQILITINKSGGTKGRLLENIADIGNYIAETGMASFFLTIKYGIETRYPPLALNEFQGDLTTMIGLMKLYKEQGDNAPYLVLLEESVQTKFAPGNYPLLWSYAMGVGVTLDRSMNNLNFNRGFLEPNYFRLGQEVVNKMEGNIDTKMAADLGLSPEQIQGLKDLIKEESNEQTRTTARARISGMNQTLQSSTLTYSEDEEEETQEIKQEIPEVNLNQQAARYRRATDESKKETAAEFKRRLDRIAADLKNQRKDNKGTINAQLTAPDTTTASDIEVMNNM
ncbi:nucleocapsid protein [Hipposideros bat paramyxovirus]|nr:nucleocapsid protein [Hipposideros bat paramyxovirus]